MQIILTKQEQRKLRRIIRKVKRAIPYTIAITFLVGLIGAIGYSETHYTIEATVIECADNVYKLEDIVGDVWEYEKDETEYEVGTDVTLIMHNGYTYNTKEDDMIVRIK